VAVEASGEGDADVVAADPVADGDGVTDGDAFAVAVAVAVAVAAADVPSDMTASGVIAGMTKCGIIPIFPP
jgi:hypothetical protein